MLYNLKRTQFWECAFPIGSLTVLVACLNVTMGHLNRCDVIRHLNPAAAALPTIPLATRRAAMPLHEVLEIALRAACEWQSHRSDSLEVSNLHNQSPLSWNW